MKGFFFVQAERLELSHLAALDPKSSVSTNSTTLIARVLGVTAFSFAHNLQAVTG